MLADGPTFPPSIDDICPVSGSDTQCIERIVGAIVPFHPFKNGSQSNPPGHFLPRLADDFGAGLDGAGVADFASAGLSPGESAD